MAVVALPIRKNDNVVVIAGRDRGKRGRVLRVIPDSARVVVEGHTQLRPGRPVREVPAPGAAPG